jgi:hypothetical protein
MFVCVCVCVYVSKRERDGVSVCLRACGHPGK